MLQDSNPSRKIEERPSSTLRDELKGKSRPKPDFELEDKLSSKLPDGQTDRSSSKRAGELGHVSRDPEDLQLLSVKEVCKRTGLGRTKIYEELKSGRLESWKRGKRRLISLSALRRWIERYLEK